MRKPMLTGISIMMALGFTTACGSNQAGNEARNNHDETRQKDDPEPVTLKMYTFQNFTSEEMLNDSILEPLKKKYPYISVEVIRSQSGGMTLPDLLASGTTPDLVNGWQAEIKTLENYHLVGDMAPLAKQHHIDLDRFEPVALGAIKALSDKGELYGIPYNQQFNALYYNKDIFDKFGVPYPKDGMTWEDAIELGKQVSRQENGIQYRGLAYEHASRLSSPLSPNIVDPKTEKANVNNDTWRKVFQLGKDILTIPNNMPPKVDSGDTDAFWKNKTVAMYATINMLENSKGAMEKGLNLGVAQYPSYKELPDTYGYLDAHFIVVTPQSKNKDAAMKVVEVMTSDEVQLKIARKYGKMSPLKNPDIKKQLAADMPHLKGIDLQSIFKSKPAAGMNLSKYYIDARRRLMAEYVNFANGASDLNTALRNAEESINKFIATEQAKEK
ncbi:ABC transporter substrate-binding protein [Paenibacillus hamazuiensis]|uniref:ABC transporter substrate-binding protein n=1 Tax=Paenibacillus hamazuiensis TaxID=2936508 RepID=UPI00200DA35A|nr:extracellular solute-binding protein [Paenibacillus hamazuiensis]